MMHVCITQPKWVNLLQLNIKMPFNLFVKDKITYAEHAEAWFVVDSGVYK